MKLDDLLGTLRVKVKAGDRDVTSKSEVTAQGERHKLQLSPKGDLVVTIIPAGFYGVQAMYQRSGSNLAEVTVGAGQITDVTLEVDVPGRIILVPMLGDKPAPLRKVQAWFYRTAGQETAFEADEDRLTASMRAGAYDLRAQYEGVPVQVRTLENLQVRAGESQEVKVVFDPVGRLRVKLTSDGKPYKAGDPWLMLYPAGREFDSDDYLTDLEKVEKGVYELELKEGSYDIKITHIGEGFSDKKFYDFEIKGGKLREEILDVGDSGTLRIKLVSGGKPHREGRIMVYEPGTEFGEYVCDLEEVEKGVYENKLKEGNYDIQLINLGAGFPGKKLYDVEVVGGSTTEKTLELGGIGRLQVRLIGEEKYEWVRLMLYTVDDNDYVCDLEPDGSGRWVARLREGEYKLEITDGFNNQWVRDLIVEPDGTLEKSITLSLGDDDWDDDDDWDSWETDDDWDDDDWDSWDNDDDWDDNDDW